MKAVRRDELRPCRCGKPLGMFFQVVESSLAMVRCAVSWQWSDARSAQQAHGLEVLFGGGPAGPVMADAMGPGVKVTLAAEERPELLTRRLMCLECYSGLVSILGDDA